MFVVVAGAAGEVRSAQVRTGSAGRHGADAALSQTSHLLHRQAQENQTLQRRESHIQLKLKLHTLHYKN